ncbi:hypothetical protein BaRGS_00027147 [Batillaria attramentaria]|uniref:Uncharacterized protein n=1 Tax=Batillaria attramentaria TaxID=370345 RepID=A0ABD0K3Q3_9CAEN
MPTPGISTQDFTVHDTKQQPDVHLASEYCRSRVYVRPWWAVYHGGPERQTPGSHPPTMQLPAHEKQLHTPVSYPL